MVAKKKTKKKATFNLDEALSQVASDGNGNGNKSKSKLTSFNGKEGLSYVDDDEIQRNHLLGFNEVKQMISLNFIIIHIT